MEDTCVICGEIVPEGRQVCPVCESKYRGLSIQPKDVLLDTIQSCLCIMGRNGIRPDDYRHYLTGINAIQSHIFRGRINGENAGMLACEIMYLAACLLTKADSFERVSDPEAYKDSAFTLKGMKRINYIINAVNLDCDRKFKNFWGSSKAIQRLSDLICLWTRIPA